MVETVENYSKPFEQAGLKAVDKNRVFVSELWKT